MDQGVDFGPYRIVEKLGEGGMGVVYRAVDTRLERPVALKVLSPHLSADSGAAERFVREAQAAASAEHTNICTIYEIGQTEDARRFIAMPLYEGRTVRDLIDDGPLEIDAAIDITIQTARGLGAAHARGVTHRDIKPGNLIVTGDGTVKILDFGLARTVDQDTITAPGSTLGTAAYMSPEQVQGNRLDGRTDIWSLGVVLHEMVTGSKPFRGEYPQAVVYGILNEDPPPLTSLRTGVPIGLDAVVAKCLRKDRDSRYQHVDEIPADLAAIRRGSEGSLSQAAAARSVPATALPRRRLTLGVAASAVLLLLALVLIRFGLPTASSDDARRTMRWVMMLQEDGRLTSDRPSLAISDDGEMVVYAATVRDTARLYVRPMNSFESRLIQGTEGAEMPFFSPDGQWIGYFTSDALFRVPIHGGRPELVVVNSIGNAPIASGAWIDEDRILYTRRDGRLGVVSPRGEELGIIGQEAIQDLEYLRFPEIMPDGRHVLATCTKGLSARIVALSLDEPGMRTVIESGTRPRYLSSGRLVFGVQSNLYAVPFDAARMEVAGQAVQVVSGVATSSLFSGTYFDVSDDGTLVYVSEAGEEWRTTMTWVDSSGAMESMPVQGMNAFTPRISPNGRYVAFHRRLPNDTHVYLADLERGGVSRFTTAGPSIQEFWFAWTPDSRSLIFNSTADSQADSILHVELFTKPIDVPGMGTRISEDPANLVPQQMSSDGRYLFYVRSSPREEGTKIDIWVRDFETGEDRPVLATEANEFHPDLSPDGRWLAYASDQTGSWQVFVQPWPEGGSVQQVSTESMGGGEPLWSQDGRILYFRSRDGRYLYETNVYDAPLSSTERTLRLESTRPVLGGPYFVCSEWGRSYDVASDGRFLLIHSAMPGFEMGQLNVVLNWTDEIGRVKPGIS